MSDVERAAIASLGALGTDRAGMLAMELQRGMDRREGRERNIQHVEVEVPPNDVMPATIHQYLYWLDGFIGNGGRPTHSCPYPFPEGWLYAPVGFAVNGQCGASSVQVIVGPGAEISNPNSWKPFGGYGHNNLFLMSGYATAGIGRVPVYSDQQFDPYRPLVKA